MELTGAIKALEALKEPCDVTLFSDSEYLVNSLTKRWAENWRLKGWRRKGNAVVPNWDLWTRLLDLCDHHQVDLRWVQGHAGHVENERCDELAVAAAKGPDLAVDTGYEQPPLP
jgi:ribonuclease HI